MSKIFAIHSFRGGTGKSNTTANISVLLAAEGLHVGVIDTDIQSPGIHVLFGLDPQEMRHTLDDYLWGKCEIAETAHDMTSRLGMDIGGKIFLVPSSMDTGDIARILREGYDVGLLNDGINELIEALDLDALLIDTHPGLNEETLLSIAISDTLILIMRPDQQDFQGTIVTVDVARRLNVADMVLIVNKAPEVLDFDQLKKDLEKLYGCTVAAILPHSDEMMVLGGKGIFSLNYPDHPVTVKLKKIIARLMA